MSLGETLLPVCIRADLVAVHANTGGLARRGIFLPWIAVTVLVVFLLLRSYRRCMESKDVS